MDELYTSLHIKDDILLIKGINYQPQLISRISCIVSRIITAECPDLCQHSWAHKCAMKAFVKASFNLLSLEEKELAHFEGKRYPLKASLAGKSPNFYFKWFGL